jgi:serine/threonine protein kinase
LSFIESYDSGRWRIESQIGEGSFGKVYKISREEFGLKVFAALKVIPVPHTSSDITHLRAEGLEGNSLQAYIGEMVGNIVTEIKFVHEFRGTSNIVSYEDHTILPKEGEPGYLILIRMELLESLEHISISRSLSEGEAVKVGIDICRALELLAKNNTVHRDVKPDNILLSKHGDCKLGDFGIARQIDRTNSGMSLKGTHSYMAPEVYKGRPYGNSIDFYSLGLVMYWLLNNRRMPFISAYAETFSQSTRDTALASRMRGEPLPPPAFASPNLAAIILKACAYDRDGRYKSAAEMRNALENCGIEPVTFTMTLPVPPPDEPLEETVLEATVLDNSPELKEAPKIKEAPVQPEPSSSDAKQQEPVLAPPAKPNPVLPDEKPSGTTEPLKTTEPLETKEPSEQKSPSVKVEAKDKPEPLASQPPVEPKAKKKKGLVISMALCAVLVFALTITAIIGANLPASSSSDPTEPPAATPAATSAAKTESPETTSTPQEAFNETSNPVEPDPPAITPAHYLLSDDQAQLKSQSGHVYFGQWPITDPTERFVDLAFNNFGGIGMQSDNGNESGLAWVEYVIPFDFAFFKASIALDKNHNASSEYGTAVYKVYVDDVEKFSKPFAESLTGLDIWIPLHNSSAGKTLRLEVQLNAGADGTHWAFWGNPRLLSDPYEATAMREAEINNSLAEANSIELNTSVYGIINGYVESGEKDLYVFEVSNPGFLGVDVFTDFIPSGERFWKYKIFDVTDPETPLIQENKTGDETRFWLYPIKINPGKYCFEIEASTQWSNSEYSFRLNYHPDTAGEQSISDGAYFISSAVNEEMVVDSANGSLIDGTRAMLFTKHSFVNQQFQLTYLDNGFYRIENIMSQKSFDVPNGAMDSGISLVQWGSEWTHDGQENQQWILSPTSDGFYNIISRISGKYVDVQDHAVEDCSHLIINDPDNSIYQKFRFTLVEIQG